MAAFRNERSGSSLLPPVQSHRLTDPNKTKSARCRAVFTAPGNIGTPCSRGGEGSSILQAYTQPAGPPAAAFKPASGYRPPLQGKSRTLSLNRGVRVDAHRRLHKAISAARQNLAIICANAKTCRTYSHDESECSPDKAPAPSIKR
jgi:hypothetical protein